MRIFLVRHASAGKRSAWTESDELRPLDEQGEREASGIQTMLREVPLRRVCSSPALRCRQTVAALATDHSLEVEVDARLGEAADGRVDVDRALELLREKRGEPVVLCASRKLIRKLLHALGVGRDEPKLLRCKKGSVWILERRAGSIERAEYVAPRQSSTGERRAVLDIGSTSMSLLVADVGPEADRMRPVLRSRAELRLGASVKEIEPAERDRILKLARSMQDEARDAECAEFIPVATASLRNATNGDEIAQLLDEVLDSPLRVISGHEEAAIVYRAVHQRLGLAEHPSIVIDLGGGSLDLAFGRNHDIVYVASEPLGVTRLHSELVRDDPMPRKQMQAIRERVGERIAPHVAHIGGLTGNERPVCAAAGGSIRALAKLVEIDRVRDNGSGIRGISILRSELESLAKRLRRATHAERIAMPGMKTQRADLLPTAAIVLAEFLDQLELPEILVSDWGLREGLLMSPDSDRIAS